MPLPREERTAASLLRTGADYIEAGRIQDAKDCIEDAAALLEGSRDHDSAAQQHSTVEQRRTEDAELLRRERIDPTSI
ncbi:MAG: hypothetical protein OXH50_08045 [Gemmatimonadetes bacterium]|nr:hypothetical protein [Gemmatimonadota bacterium]